VAGPAGEPADDDRILLFNRDGDAPIEEFSTRFLMNTDSSPDDRGHQRIAEDVLGEVANVPSFRRHLGSALQELSIPARDGPSPVHSLKTAQQPKTP